MHQNHVPPPASPLANSLDRGHFFRTFEHCEVLGRGSFGTVVKAWHKEAKQWYAVKIIRTRARACKPFSENHKVWSGPAIFKRLRNLRCANVMKYFHCWSELPEDLLYDFEQGESQTKTPPSTVASMGLVANTANLSDDGFEWEVPTPDPPMHHDIDSSSFASSTSSDRTAAKYSIVIMLQMEFCEGITLSTWLAQPKALTGLTSTSLVSVLEIFRQIMQGLCTLHKAGIIHCDLKPANLLITKPDAQVKFFDFDCAQTISGSPNHQGSRAPLSPKLQEKVYTAIGTPGYAPPEHCTFGPSSAAEPSSGGGGCPSDDGVSPASPGVDIFSAGVILLELLMASIKGGPAWFTSMERAAALGRVRLGRGEALPVEVLQEPGIEGWLRQLVLRMVVWDPNGRPSAQEVLDELEVGLWAASRHNPNLGTQHRGLPQLAAISSPLCTAHNPYIGYFCDHRLKKKAAQKAYGRVS